MDPVVVIVTNKAFVTNFGGPVLSCIKADYCKYTLTVRHMFEIEMIYEIFSMTRVVLEFGQCQVSGPRLTPAAVSEFLNRTFGIPKHLFLS